MTDAGDKGVPSRGLGRVENGNRACARRDHGAIGKPDPLALVLTEELVADSPVRGLVLAPVGVDLSSDFGGSASARLFIDRLGCMLGLSSFYRPLARQTSAVLSPEPGSTPLLLLCTGASRRCAAEPDICHF